MIKSVDPYLTRVYDEHTYDCLDFARDVWLDHTGVDLKDRLKKVGEFHLKGSNRVPWHHTFKRIKEPTDPCLVVFQGRFQIPHIGVYIRGRVLHLRGSGASHALIEALTTGYSSVRYYLPC